MDTYLDNLISEKNIDLDMSLNVEGPSGLNIMPLRVVIDAIIGAPKHEQKGIRNTLVKIDFHNGDVMHFFNHLAGALAI